MEPNDKIEERIYSAFILKGRLKLKDLIIMTGAKYRKVRERLDHFLEHHGFLFDNDNIQKTHFYHLNSHRRKERFSTHHFYSLDLNDLRSLGFDETWFEKSDFYFQHINPTFFDTCVAAIANQHALSITYIKMNDKKESKRLVFPWGMTLVNGRLQLHAFCDSKQEFRHFLLSRIVECKVKNQERPNVSPRFYLIRAVPHEQLNEQQKAVVQREFNIIDGTFRALLSESEFFWFKKRFIYEDKADVYGEKVLRLESSDSELFPKRLLKKVQGQTLHYQTTLNV